MTAPNNTPKFGEQEFTEEELHVLRKRLEEKIGAKFISYRKGHNGSMYTEYRGDR
jgi:recombination DNA repair RAD52 pathway protein